MYQDHKVLIGKSGDEDIYIYPKMANRHGLIAGATGTGKTITLKVMAESFSDCGVPVFLADVKGDLAGMCRPGVINENLQNRITRFGLEAHTGYKFGQWLGLSYWQLALRRGDDAPAPVRLTLTEAEKDAVLEEFF